MIIFTVSYGCVNIWWQTNYVKLYIIHLPGWRGRNTILYEDNHKGLIDIPLPNVCTSLPCSALWSAGHNAGIPAPIDREELRSHIFHWWSQHPEMVIPDSHAVTSLDGLLSPCVHLFCWHTHRCDVLLLLPSQVRNDIFWKWHPVTVSNPWHRIPLPIPPRTDNGRSVWPEARKDLLLSFPYASAALETSVPDPQALPH